MCDKKRIIRFVFAVVGISLICSSCEGMFSGIYDDNEEDEIIDTNKNIYGFTSYNKQTKEGTLYLNLSNFDRWLYLCFDNQTIDTVFIPTTLTGDWDGQSALHYQYVHGSQFTFDTLIKTDTQIDPDKWDIALHKYEGKANGGVYETTFTSLSELPSNSESFDNVDYTEDEWIDTLVITDISRMYEYYIGYQNIRCNKVLSNWLVMDFSTPPPTYHPSNKVYIVKLKNNKKIALHFDNYMSAKGTLGFVTISFIYPY